LYIRCKNETLYKLQSLYVFTLLIKLNKNLNFFVFFNIFYFCYIWNVKIFNGKSAKISKCKGKLSKSTIRNNSKKKRKRKILKEWNDRFVSYIRIIILSIFNFSLYAALPNFLSFKIRCYSFQVFLKLKYKKNSVPFLRWLV